MSHHSLVRGCGLGSMYTVHIVM